MDDNPIAQQVAVPVADVRARAGPLARDRFFVGMAWVMLVINFAGFAPSYFLKGFFDTPVLPLRTHVHGVLFTSWFVLFAVQTTLVGRGKIRLHRTFGVAGAGLAALMVASGLLILYVRALEYTGTSGSLASTTTVVWANLSLLILFAGFAALGIAARRRPDVHKRLMLLASLSMMGQALGRFGRMPALRIADSQLVTEIVFAIGGLVALLLAMVVHDLVADRKVHRVTRVGVPLLFGSILLGTTVIPRTGFAQALILWLN